MHHDEKEDRGDPEKRLDVPGLDPVLSQKRCQFGGTLFAILDAASSPFILNALFRFDPERFCLFGGTPMEPLGDVAPYLVKLEMDSDMLKWLITEGWGKNCGVFFLSMWCSEDLFVHFRRFCRVQDEEGMEFVFRFYDPRILPVYLSSCTLAEADALLGPTQAVFAESGSGQSLLALSREEDRLIMEHCPLSDGVSCPEETRITLPSPEEAPGPGCIIRNEQMKCLQADLDRRRNLDLEAHAHETHPRKVDEMGEDALRLLVIRTRETAELYGIEEKDHQSRFLDFVVAFGEGFCESEWAGPILASEYLDAEDKMMLLDRYAERLRAPGDTQ